MSNIIPALGSFGCTKTQVTNTAPVTSPNKKENFLWTGLHSVLFIFLQIYLYLRLSNLFSSQGLASNKEASPAEEVEQPPPVDVKNTRLQQNRLAIQKFRETHQATVLSPEIRQARRERNRQKSSLFRESTQEPATIHRATSRKHARKKQALRKQLARIHALEGSSLRIKKRTKEMKHSSLAIDVRALP